MSGVRRLSDAYLSGSLGGAVAGQFPVFDGTGKANRSNVSPGPAYNLVPQNLPKLRRAIARVRSGTANGTIFCLGDSTTAGAGGAAPGQSYPAILAGLLNSYHVPTVQSWALASDTNVARVTRGTNWSYSQPLWLNGGASDTLSYQPSASSCNGPPTVDTVDIYYVRNSGLGTFTVNVNGGSTLATVSTAGAGPSLVKTTVSFTATANPTINLIGPTAGGGLNIAAFNAYLSTAKTLQIANFGFGGFATTNFLSNNTYNIGNWYANYSPDLSIVDLGINDAGTSVTPATFQSNMQTIITNGLTSGDMMLKSPAPSQNAPNSTGELTYIPVLNALSTSNSIPFLDGFTRWQSWTIANALGLFADSLHPSALGYSDIAEAVFNMLRTV